MPHVADTQNCDICRHEFQPGQPVYDGRLRASGVWAAMCSECYIQHGVGLGTGRGQQYKHGSYEKVAG